MSAKTTWVEVEYRGEEALALIKLVMNSKSTGQIVLNVSQGTVGSAMWRERVPVGKPEKINLALDKVSVHQDTITAESS